MKYFLLLLFLGSVIQSNAQLAPVGSVWNYSHMNSTGGGVSFWGYRFEITKDTVLGGKTYSAFEGLDTFYRTIENNKVYYWLDGNHHLLFDMTKQLGDTLILEWSPVVDSQQNIFDTVKLIFDSVFYLSDIKGTKIKVFECTKINAFELSNKFFFYDKLLYTSYTLDINELPLPDYTGFTTRIGCYREPNGYSFLMVDSSACNTVGLLETNNQQDVITIYPNPAKTFINIELPNNQLQKLKRIQLVDYAGKLILSENETENKTELNIESIAPGFYFLTIVLEDGQVLSQKIVIQH